MTQTATLPSTRSNVVDVMQELLSDRSLMRPDEILRRLIQSGVAPQEVINATKAKGLDQGMVGQFLGSAVGVLGKGEFIVDYAASLDKQERKDFLAQTGYAEKRQHEIDLAICMGATAKLKKEEAERERLVAEAMAAAAQEFQKAHTFEGKLHAVENFFAHGASLDDAIKHNIIKEEDKKRIEETDAKAKQEAKEHADKMEAEKRTELEAKGIKGKQQDEAIKKWREDEEKRIRAEEQRKLAEQAKLDGNLGLAAVAAHNADTIQKYGMSIDERAATANLDNASIKTAKIEQEAKALEERKLRGETRATDAVEEKSLRYLAKVASGSSAVPALTQEDKSALVKEYIKADGSNTMKAATAAALKSGDITEGMIGGIKQKTEADSKQSTTIASAAASFGFGDDEPSISDKLAKRRDAAESKVAAASLSGPKVA